MCSPDLVNAQNLLTCQQHLKGNMSMSCCVVFKPEQDQKLNTSLSITNCLLFGATRKHRPDDISGRTSAFLFMLWDSVPREHQSPIKSSDLRFSRVAEVLEGVPVNNIYHRTHHSRRLILYSARFREFKKVEININSHKTNSDVACSLSLT